jgi:hypothetical protein
MAEFDFRFDLLVWRFLDVNLSSLTKNAEKKALNLES